MSSAILQQAFAPLPAEEPACHRRIGESFRTAVHRLGIPSEIAPLGPLRVTASVGDRIKAAGALIPLLQRALRSAGADRAERLAALHADPSYYPFRGDDCDDPEIPITFARPDIAVSPAGPKVMEFNIGGGIGGYIETHLMQRVWSDVYGEQSPEAAGEPDPLRRWARAISESRTSDGSRPTQVCSVTSLRDFPTDEMDVDRFFDLQARQLAELGMELLITEPEGLDKRLAELSPTACVGLRNFTVFEWKFHDIDMSPIQRALDRGFNFLVPQEAYMIANKRVLAWLSEKRVHLTPEESHLVDQLVPWTRELRASGGSSNTALLAYALSSRTSLVLKRCISGQSRDVVVGRLVTPEVWRNAVEEAYAAGDSIVQELIDHQSAELAFDISGERTQRHVQPVLSPFFVRGLYSGCMVRYLPDGSVGPSSVDADGAVLNTAVLG
nr:hypothetical protein OH820_28425 [Streptomyces sp. NBC_00857]